jgi:hypothetical protein
MLICCLLRCSANTLHPNFAYVVNNPTNWSYSYCLPVGVITFGSDKSVPVFSHPEHPLPVLDVKNGVDSKAAASIKGSSLFSGRGSSSGGHSPGGNGVASATAATKISSSFVAPFRWHWYDDTETGQPYRDDVNALIESRYDAHIHHGAASKFVTGPIIRYVDDVPQAYEIDFKAMYQTNCKTRFKRIILRQAVPEAMLSNGKVQWEYMNDTGVWTAFESLSVATIEQHYLLYAAGHGAGNVLLVTAGRESYLLDFVAGRQTNATTNKVRQIRRRL